MTVCAVVSQAVVGRQRGRCSRAASLAGGWEWLQEVWSWWPCRSGERPCPVAAGQAMVDEVAQVEGGGAVLEPGVVAGGAEVAELEAAPAAGGELGDGPLDVGPVVPVVLAQGWAGGPGAAGGAQQRVVFGQVEGPACTASELDTWALSCGWCRWGS